MKLSAILAPLIAAGVPGDVILATVKAFEEQQTDALERRRASDRERQSRHRNVTSRDVTVTAPSREGVTRVEDISSNLEIDQKKEIKKVSKARAALTPVQELETVLDAERAQAVVDHRQRIRKPLTAHAAKLLATELAKAPDPNAAADEMIAAGWSGFKVAWLQNRTDPRQGTGPPANGKRTYVDVAADRMNGHGPAGIFGNHGYAQRISADDRQRGPDGGDIRGGVAGRYITSDR